MNKNEYVKVVYQSEPIGKDNIILELTTFDYEKYEKDQELKKINKFQKIEVDKNMNLETNYNSFNTININYEHIISRLISEDFYKEHEKLMKIIEHQQERIIELTNEVATPKLSRVMFKDL